MKRKITFTLFLLSFCSYIAFGQTKTISGHVTAQSDGTAIPAATIRVAGTTNGAVADESGDFSIQVSPGDTLIINSLGFNPQHIAVGNQSNLNITLASNSQTLRETVVTALGIRREKKSLGYSTTELPGSDFTKSRDPNIGNALTGKVAGVSVAGDATGPYGSSRVIIRGNASLTGNNQPLYVIDGIPYDNSVAGSSIGQGSSGQYGGADFGNGLTNIDPDDIQSIQVLKGVAASALYGYRGGNGAILITTKSGARSQGFGVEFNNNITFNKINDQRDYQYVYGQGTLGVKPTTAAAAQASENSSWGPKIDGSDAVNFLGDTYKYLPQKDNFENFYQTGLSNQTSVAVTGANDKGHFRLGLSNLYLNTVIPNSNMKQQGINFNTTYNVTKKLQMTLTANYSIENVKNRASFSDAPGNVIASTMYIANTFDIRWLQPATTPDGNELLPGSDIYFNNPYFVAYDYQNKTSRNRLTGGLTLKYNLLDWLYVQGQVTRDGYIYDLKNILPSGTGYNKGGQLTQYEINYHELNGSFMVGMNKNLGSNFKLDAFIGGNSQDNVSQLYGIVAAGPFQIPGFYSANNIANKPFTTNYSHYRVNSLYGSADLGYKDFLFLTVTARNDWFSTLNINSDNYLYPSFSGSFVFSQALHLPSWISFGKLRASYAEGSNGTDPYANILTYGLQGYTTNGQSLGYVTQAGSGSGIPNSSLRPVQIAEKEAGINVKFFNDRLGVDLAYYNKRTTDDIVKVTVSPTSGYFANYLNIGEIRNQGLELLLTGTPVKTPDFSWNISLNYAHNNSKVLHLGEDGNPIVIGGAYPRWGNGVSVSNVVGLPYGQIMGYTYKRDDNGKVIYNASGEPEPTADIIPLGSGVYKTTGGINDEFHYKNFDLSFLVDFKFGAKIYSGTNLLLTSYGLQKMTLQGRENGYVGPGVTEDGKPNDVSVPAQQYWQDISTQNDMIPGVFLYDASFVKLRSLSLGYTLPASVLRNSFIKGISLSLVGRNLAILMKHTPNIDPESSINSGNGQGLELAGYPPIRNIGFNVNVKF